MTSLDCYLKKLTDTGNRELADSVKATAEKADEMYLRKHFFGDATGLLFGNVQSGKTAQMFGIICKAEYKGFPLFILLTTDNVELQNQTLERVKRDLGESFCICDEGDLTKFEDNRLEKPCIIVLKKNSRVLKKWADVLENTGFVRGNSLMILDDEGDAASLNTLVNKRGVSSINKQLQRIRAGALSEIYLEVTGTPQALLLQTAVSGWHPDFIQYFEPGKGYLGGNFFFPADKISPAVSVIDDEDQALEDFIFHHLAVSAQLSLTGDSVCNALIHPGVRTRSHDKEKLRVSAVLDRLKQNKNDFFTGVEKVWKMTEPKKSGKEPLSAVQNEAWAILNDKLSVFEMNSQTFDKTADHTKGFNIVIGGNSLGRGVTFPKLHSVIYTRTSKNPQADTMWQHNRMFGYDRDSGLMRVWMPAHLYKLFSDINLQNESIISQVNRGLNDIQIVVSGNLKPTRKNVLDQNEVVMISGGVNYYPDNPKVSDLTKLDSILSHFDENQDEYQVSLQLVRQILSFYPREDNGQISDYIRAVDAMLAEQSTTQARLIVRRDRNITQGTGALISPNDWKLGGEIKKQTVLTMYRMGENAKGWKQEGVWIPNIKLPEDKIYFLAPEQRNNCS